MPLENYCYPSVRNTDDSHTGKPSRSSRHPLYTQIGTDPPWSVVVGSGNLGPLGTSTDIGFQGSVIKVDKQAIGAEQARSIPQNIKIHTLGNSYIGRRFFHKWSRWYQEDGGTQIFRLFQGEKNTNNLKAADRARIEAFTTLNFVLQSSSTAVWHEWAGQFLIVQPTGGAIFQSKNSKNDWAFMITMSPFGDITFQPRWGTYITVATNMVGKTFTVKVRDNGNNYEAYYNGVLKVNGTFSRPSGTNNFRWGIYKGNSAVTADCMLFVSDVTFH